MLVGTTTWRSHQGRATRGLGQSVRHGPPEIDAAQALVEEHERWVRRRGTDPPILELAPVDDSELDVRSGRLHLAIVLRPLGCNTDSARGTESA